MPESFDWITPQLAIGGRLAGEPGALVARHRIGAVVDLRAEACDEPGAFLARGVEFLHLPTDDLCAVSEAMLDQGVAFAGRVLAEGRRLLVHCQNGVGRSALLALCILVDGGWPPLGALLRAKDARWQVSPSPAQYEAWAGWLARRGLSTPGFDAFRAIAYRHLAGV